MGNLTTELPLTPMPLSCALYKLLCWPCSTNPVTCQQPILGTSPSGVVGSVIDTVPTFFQPTAIGQPCGHTKEISYEAPSSLTSPLSRPIVHMRWPPSLPGPCTP